MYEFKLDPVSKLLAFSGFCRDASDEKEETHYLDANNVYDCYSKCRTTDGCIAFAHEYDAGNSMDCTLYRAGPYIRGNGFANVGCYLMDIGKCSHNCNTSINTQKNIPDFFNNVLFRNFSNLQLVRTSSEIKEELAKNMV